MKLHKIVITGGPCSGKTTAIKKIRDSFERSGYAVLCIPETATELIGGGIAPWSCRSNTDFQKCLMQLQLEKEKIFKKAARTMSAEKILILCDRGALDNKAYMTDGEFDYILSSVSTNEVELRDGYDAVFHMVTAAKGAESFYSVSNNMAQTESPEAAIELDERILSAWVGHPHLRIIDNSTDFDGKINRLLHEIEFFLGEPEPLEIERKFLIEYPDIQWLNSLPNCRRVEINQTYMKNSDGENTRIRQRGESGNYIYFLTQKKSISPIKRIEIERRLSKDEYTDMLATGTNKRQISKDRYCLVFDNQYFEIDVFPFWNDKAIMEIELSDENAEIRFPEKMRIIKEVTGDKAYNNSSLAKDVK